MLKERRVLLSKHLAKLELKDRMDSIKLSQAEQDTFFRRYDMFEKRAFRSLQGFYGSKHSRSSGALTPKFQDEPRYALPSKEDIAKQEYLAGRPFERNVNNFKIRKSNHIYRSLSALASIDTTMVRGSYEAIRWDCTREGKPRSKRSS
jgi:hypothetical protein